MKGKLPKELTNCKTCLIDFVSNQIVVGSTGRVYLPPFGMYYDLIFVLATFYSAN